MDQQEFYLNQSLDHECFKLPEKDKKYLSKNNFLSEYFTKEDKAQVRSNLGITSLLDELKNLLLAKLFNEQGNVTFDLEPHEDAHNKVLSSSTIYNILLNYYTKEELDEWKEGIVDQLNEHNKPIELNVDEELDKDSVNPVQNRAIYEKIKNITDGYNRLSSEKVDKDQLLNYYTVDEIDDFLSVPSAPTYATDEDVREIFDKIMNQKQADNQTEI